MLSFSSVRAFLPVQGRRIHDTHGSVATEGADDMHLGEGTMFPATYVSADALERADAYRLGYRTVCQHPREIGVPEATEMLVIDFNHVLFDDQATAVAKANAHARRGLLVGIHTYYPQALEVLRLAALPNVVVAKTHRELLVELGRLARLRGRPWLCIAEEAESPDSAAVTASEKKTAGASAERPPACDTPGSQ
jgi:hypothetical protein